MVNIRMLAWASAIALALTLFSCGSPTLSSPSAAGTGSLSLLAAMPDIAAQRIVRSSGLARTSFPTVIDVSTLIYSLSLTSSTSSSSPISGGTSSTGEFPTVTMIPEGSWTATVTATASGVTIGTGSASITITPEATTTATINLAPPSTGAGTLAFNCTWDYAATPALIITPIAPAGSAATPTLPSSTSPLSYTTSLTAGMYRIATTLVTSAGVQCGASEIVYIFAGYTTSLSYAVPDASYKSGNLPTAPTAVSAVTGYSSAKSSAYAYISWTGAGDAESYAIERRMGSAPLTSETYTTIKTGITAASYTDSSLTTDNYYQYRVSAVNATGTSATSTASNAASLLRRLTLIADAGGSISTPISIAEGTSGFIDVRLGASTAITAVVGSGTWGNWSVTSGAVDTFWNTNLITSVVLISVDTTLTANF
jgi:hypothetical protein